MNTSISLFESASVRSLIRLALEEDCVDSDVTSNLCIDADLKGRALLLAREPMVLCGLPIIRVIFAERRSEAKVKIGLQDGHHVVSGAILGEIEGSYRDLLSTERTILNFLQRLCGVATRAGEIAKKAAPLKVLDTRKTTPGWRALEKYAVQVGGAQNHRANLSDMILIKNNHVDAYKGDIESLLKKVLASRAEGMKVEVEVRNDAELNAVLKYQVDVIMLDNMNDLEIRSAVKKIRERASGVTIELSGGITPKRLDVLRSIGADYVSLGSLTSAARSVDISMKIEVVS